jgi:hypothetical protein
VWGASYARGTSAPSGSGYTKIYSTKYAFAALKADGTITAWGHSLYGGTGAPAGSVGVPLMVQVALSILKPVGSAGATAQLAIAPPELLKVMFF